MPGRSVIYSFLFILAMALPRVSRGQNTHFSVLDRNRDDHAAWLAYPDRGLALYKQISGYAGSLLDEREEGIGTLHSREDWEAYTREMRQKIFTRTGEFERTPLNARVTKTVAKEGYRIENIVFESHPGFYVTGSLFLPGTSTGSLQQPLPCVIYCSGHTESGYRDPVYLNVILNMVGKGIAVYAFDPAGQGERLQYPGGHEGGSLIGGPTSEHSYPGAQLLVLGESLSDYMIWDGVRAVDYLLSRPEIDSARIGITGRSGGGTQSAFIAAFDERISALATESYITSYRRIFESIGPQDAEQNPYRALRKGFDHADLLHLIAPRPLLVVSTTNDFFSIQGARESFVEAQRSYAAFNAGDLVAMVESSGVHESTLSNREAVYAFFLEYFGLEGKGKEEKVELPTPEEIQVTRTGQVSGSYRDQKTLFDLMQDRAEKAAGNRQDQISGALLDDSVHILEMAREMSGLDTSRRIGSVVFTGVKEGGGYRIEKYFIQGEDFAYPIPFVLVKPPEEEPRPLLLYLDPEGKNKLVNDEAAILHYLDKGYTILAPDLLGTGEVANISYRGDSYIRGTSYNILFGANLCGTSVAGMQAGDLEVIFRHIMTRSDVDADKITALVSGETCSSYLHFAIFHTSIKKTILVRPLISYEDVVRTRMYSTEYIRTVVPGALQFYDLPDLEAMLAPSGLIIVNPVRADGEAAGRERVNRAYSPVMDAYGGNECGENFELLILEDKDVHQGIDKFF